MTKKQRQKKSPALAGPLTIENARAQQQLFHQRSRREYRGQPTSPDVDYDTADMRRIVFGIYLEIADFAGSLMSKVERDRFAGRFDVLYGALEAYRQEMGSMFPAEGREQVLGYINDVAAGAYDMVDAFLGVAAEYRPQLLHLVSQFEKGNVNLQHHKTVPQMLLESVPDQSHRERIYAEYYELGYRVVIHDTSTGLSRYPSVVALPQNYDGALTIDEVAVRARSFLSASNALAKLPSAGIVYHYFPL